MGKIININYNRVYACYLTSIKEVNENEEYIKDISNDKDLKKVHSAIKELLLGDNINTEDSLIMDDFLIYQERPEYVFMSSYNDDLIHRKNDSRKIKKIVHFINPITLKHMVFEQTKNTDLADYYKIYKAIKNTDEVLRNQAIVIGRNVFWEEQQTKKGISKTKVLELNNQEFANYMVENAKENNIWLFLDINIAKLSLDKAKQRKLTY